MAKQIKGHLELATLRILSEGERHGYGIVQMLKLTDDDFLRAGEGTVYPLLRKLEQDGYVKSRWTGGRKVYRLSRKGTHSYAQSLERWTSFSTAMNRFLANPIKGAVP